MRNAKNGNCLPVGGFCTAVHDIYCEIAQQAYRHGYFDHIHVSHKAEQFDKEKAGEQE